MKTFGSLKIRFSIFFIKISSNSQILYCLTEIPKNCKNEASQIEIFGNIILAFLDSFIDICNWFIEVIFVEVKNWSEIIKSRNVVVRKLWKMRNAYCQILYRLFQIVIFDNWICLFLKFIVDYVECKIKIWLWLVWNHLYCFLQRLSWRFWEVFVCCHYQFIIVFR